MQPVEPSRRPPVGNRLRRRSADRAGPQASAAAGFTGFRCRARRRSQPGSPDAANTRPVRARPPQDRRRPLRRDGFDFGFSSRLGIAVCRCAGSGLQDWWCEAKPTEPTIHRSGNRLPGPGERQSIPSRPRKRRHGPLTKTGKVTLLVEGDFPDRLPRGRSLSHHARAAPIHPSPAQLSGPGSDR
jgi:hypothetical protein